MDDVNVAVRQYLGDDYIPASVEAQWFRVGYLACMNQCYRALVEAKIPLEAAPTVKAFINGLFGSRLGIGENDHGSK